MSSFQRYLIWWPVKSLSIETAVSKCVNATCVNFPIVNVLVSFKPHFFSWLLFLFSYLSIFSWHWLLYFGIFSSITLKMFIWNWKICLQRQSYCRWHLKDRLGIPQPGSGLAGGGTTDWRRKDRWMNKWLSPSGPLPKNVIEASGARIEGSWTKVGSSGAKIGGSLTMI